jgi:tRNA (guanine-N7-)-methyltransferase
MKHTSGLNPLSDAQPGRRDIRSFVLREGRITQAQSRALDELWPRFGIASTDGMIDPDQVFGRSAATTIEIGFGDGQALAYAAELSPDENFIGIEVHRPGIGALMIRLEQADLNNVRILCADATRVLADRIADQSLAGVRVFFPDPWPKKRHHKRRIIQAGFVELIFRKLVPGGYLHLATDWENYAEQMVDVLQAHPGFANTSEQGDFVPRPDWRPETKFERRGRRLGHGVWDLLYRKPGR